MAPAIPPLMPPAKNVAPLVQNSSSSVVRIVRLTVPTKIPSVLPIRAFDQKCAVGCVVGSELAGCVVIDVVSEHFIARVEAAHQIV